MAHGQDYFNPDVETLLNQAKMDSLSRSFVLSYTGGKNISLSEGFFLLFF